MNITSAQSHLVTLRPGDPGFLIIDGNIMAPRAGFQVLHTCPREYRAILTECIDRGWLRPIATVFDHEQTFNALKS